MAFVCSHELHDAVVDVVAPDITVMAIIAATYLVPSSGLASFRHR
jgi:hypothetical protein